MEDRIQKEVYDTPLREIGEFLRGAGIPPIHLNQGLLAVVGFNSARLGYPIHIVLTEDEGALGAGLLNICRDLSPSEGIIEFLEIPDISQYPLKGKTIFLPHSPTKDKRLKALSLLLDNNRVSFQDLPKGSRQTGFGNEIEGPVGLLAFVKDASSEILELPFAIRFHISLPTGSAAERTIEEEKGFRPNSPEYRVGRNYRKALLARLTPQEVEIPFFDQMVKSIRRIETARFLINSLKVITIINHFEAASMEEMILKFMSYEAGERIERSSESSMFPVSKISRGPLISTPYDYFCLKTLVDGRLSDGKEELTMRQMRVFETLKSMNLSYLGQSTFEGGKTLETLEHPSHIRGWADIREILTRVNEGQEDKFSRPTLDKDMQVLLDKGIIQRSKVSNNPIRFVYAIRTLSVESGFVKLPNPRDLHNVSSSGPIRGRNPVTGKVEEI